ncbi:hypothetical protein GNI_048370, partial [Gregarina niphandrodes]
APLRAPNSDAQPHPRPPPIPLTPARPCTHGLRRPINSTLAAPNTHADSSGSPTPTRRSILPLRVPKPPHPQWVVIRHSP